MQNNYEVSPLTTKNITLLIKPASGSCNLRCSYCFYADEMTHRAEAARGMMDQHTLETVVKKALQAVSGQVNFAFQGGEPTLAGLGFYRELIRLQQQENTSSVSITNALQTNGYLIDENWAEFLADNRFLVGLSIDGTRRIHDQYRKDPDGNGTLTRVMQSARLLKEYRAEFNILTVVTNQTAGAIRPIYNFFKRQGFSYQQYIACLEPLDLPPGEQNYSLTPVQYGEFLCQLFNLWYNDMIKGESIYIRQFQNILDILLGYPPESCDMRGVCSEQWVIEANGDVYPCDFYSLDQWKLGNILTDSFTEMNTRRYQLQFIQQSLDVPEKCKSCRWHKVCRNGCRRNRMLKEGIPDLNYFCQSYQTFLDYSYPKFLQLIPKK